MPDLTLRKVRMPDVLWATLDELAAANGHNVADEIRLAIVAHLVDAGYEVDDTLALSGRGRRGEGRRPRQAVPSE